MPIYEYECETCGKVFEVRQKFADALLTTHEGCGGALHRLLSAPALQFKGSGWYITDYGRGGSVRSGNSESKPAGDSGSSDSKSSDSKSSDSKSSDSKPAGGSDSKREAKSKSDSPAPAHKD